VYNGFTVFGSHAWHVCVRCWGPDYSMRGICAACRHVLRHVGVTWYECHAAGSRCTVSEFSLLCAPGLDLDEVEEVSVAHR
jgi:hypothetical protein